MRKAISIAFIKDKSVLLVKKGNYWILPGGKPNKNEGDLRCLERELSEELPLLKVNNMKYYNSFSGVTPHKKDMLEAKVYLADCDGDIMPSAEITDSAWISNFKDCQLSDITAKIIRDFKEKKYI